MSNFNAVDACEDIDAVWRENGKCCHVEVVEVGKVDQSGTIWHECNQKVRYDHVSDAVGQGVDDQQRQSPNGGEKELVPPSEIKDVV